MASNPPDDSQRPPGTQALIFMSDASAEAERLSSSLRQRGHAVVDVPLALLVGRVAVQQPALLICDADAEEALATLEALQEVPSSSAIDVLLIGMPDGVLTTRRDEVAREASGTFPRPVDVYALLKKVEALIGPSSGASSAPSVAPATRSAVLLGSSRPPPPSSDPRAAMERRDRRVPSLPPLEGRPGSEQPGEPPGSLVPLPLDADPSRSIGPSELSPELVELLRQAEERVDLAEAPSSQPKPDALQDDEDDTTAPLPPDVLLALEEELEDEEPPDSAESIAPDEPPSVRTGERGSGASPGPEFEPSAAVRSAIETSGHVTTVGRETGTGLTDDGSEAPHSRPGGTAADKTSAELPIEQGEREAITPKPPRPGSELPPPTEAADPNQEPSTNPPRPRQEVFAPAAPPDPQIRHFPTSTPAAPDPPLLHLDRVPPPEMVATLPPPARSRRAPGPPTSVQAPPHALPPDTLSPTNPPLKLPDSLRQGDALSALATAIRQRYTGCLAFEVDEGIRRVVFRDGDFVTAASGVHGESLVAVLVNRGELPPGVQREGHKLPPSGRHAGAALIAQGHLTQDQLWPVLRTHAEWIVGQIVGIERGAVRAELEVSGRLQEEPAVFGGATGAEVLVEIVRRIVSASEAKTGLGGAKGMLREGPQLSLLSECALTAEETELVHRSVGSTVDHVASASADGSAHALLYALVELGVLSVGATRLDPRRAQPPPPPDDLDDAAIRERIEARKALVDEGDYFSVLGVGRAATSYEIKRAYLELRREFEPSHSLTARTADLRDTVDEIVDVIEEAYEILKDATRRERYRRAIEAAP